MFIYKEFKEGKGLLLILFVLLLGTSQMKNMLEVKVQLLKEQDLHSVCLRMDIF